MKTHAQYQEVIDAIESQGVAFTDLVDRCCKSCIHYESSEEYTSQGHEPLIRGYETDSWGYTFIGQAPKLRWNDEGILVYWEHQFDDEDDEGDDVHGEPHDIGAADYVYVYHGSEHAARVISDAFQAGGFTVDWDGNLRTAIKVELS